jgi:hypothetical protein
VRETGLRSFVPVDNTDKAMSSEEPQKQPQTDTESSLESVPLDPPADCIKVTDDGGVLKHVVAEGSGDLPVRHGRCLGKPGLHQHIFLQHVESSCAGKATAKQSIERAKVFDVACCCCCFTAVHYVGRCIPSGEVFMDTKEETQGADPIVVIAGRGEADCVCPPAYCSQVALHTALLVTLALGLIAVVSYPARLPL